MSRTANAETRESKNGRDLPHEATENGKPHPIAVEQHEQIRKELQRILQSRYFKTAGRSRQFLEFVVEHQLAGNPEQLKERTIGTHVFQRPADYATGDDPVVRVQAGEVRRRLEQFYQHEGAGSPLHIDLPVGSYCPEFHWNPNGSENSSSAAIAPREPITAAAPQRPKRFKTAVLLASSALVILAVIASYYAAHRVQKQSTLEAFWAPVLKTPQPALICLAKGVTYRPSAALYAKYRAAHPGTFETEVQRSSDALPLDPNETMHWRDMWIYSDYGVADGDVYAAIRISGVLGQLRKPTQLRIGSDSTFQDLRNSPSVIVGAFNNKWTMNQMSNLHFAFVEKDGHFWIQEQIPNGR